MTHPMKPILVFTAINMQNKVYSIRATVQFSSVWLRTHQLQSSSCHLCILLLLLLLLIVYENRDNKTPLVISGVISC